MIGVGGQKCRNDPEHFFFNDVVLHFKIKIFVQYLTFWFCFYLHSGSGKINFLKYFENEKGMSKEGK